MIDVISMLGSDPLMHSRCNHLQRFACDSNCSLANGAFPVPIEIVVDTFLKDTGGQSVLIHNNIVV